MRENEFEQQEITSQEEAVEMASEEGVYFSILRDGPETIEIEDPIVPNIERLDKIIPLERIFITPDAIGVYGCSNGPTRAHLYERYLPFENYMQMIDNGTTEYNGCTYTCETLKLEDPDTRERFLEIVKQHAKLLQEDF